MAGALVLALKNSPPSQQLDLLRVQSPLQKKKELGCKKLRIQNQKVLRRGFTLVRCARFNELSIKKENIILHASTTGDVQIKAMERIRQTDGREAILTSTSTDEHTSPTDAYFAAVQAIEGAFDGVTATQSKVLNIAAVYSNGLQHETSKESGEFVMRMQR